MLIPTRNKALAISLRIVILLTKPIVAVTAESIKIDNKINVNGIFHILLQSSIMEAY
jgi:hypothetical protein